MEKGAPHILKFFLTHAHAETRNEQALLILGDLALGIKLWQNKN